MTEQEAIDHVAHMLKKRDDRLIQTAVMSLGSLARIRREDIDYRALAVQKIASKLQSMAVDAIRDELFPPTE